MPIDLLTLELLLQLRFFGGTLFLILLEPSTLLGIGLLSPSSSVGSFLHISFVIPHFY